MSSERVTHNIRFRDLILVAYVTTYLKVGLKTLGVVSMKNSKKTAYAMFGVRVPEFRKGQKY